MSEHVVGGRYRLQQQLGRGGMASVWRAQDIRLDRSAAVKVLDPVWRTDPVALERLRQEARSVAGLAHEHIVGVYDFDVAGESAYLVMELVDGRSVSELLIQQGPMPVEEAVSIAAQTCDALGAAHAAGIVHRDIKPSNILVGPAGLVKVCDFGLARLHRAAAQSALTGTGTVVGTCQYMSPEQALGERVDGRSDLYAVGCLLYMMLVGAPPFTGGNPIDVLDLHLNEPPVPLRAHRADVPPALQQLIDELLAKDRADRPATAWSVRDRLSTIGGASAASPSDTDPPAADPPTTELRTAEDWPTVAVPALPGRHRVWATTPVLRWHRRWVSDWVAVLVAVAVATVGLAVIMLAGGGERATSISAPPPSRLTAPPEATALPADPALSPEPSPPSAAARSTPTIAPTTAPARATAVDQVTGLASLLQQRADAGTLRPKAAKTLLRDLNGVLRSLSGGANDQAAERFAEFRDRVTEFGNDGELIGALPDLGRIAESIDAG
jgi:eukaryotic-like serine/threonine-protein kinase